MGCRLSLKPYILHAHLDQLKDNRGNCHSSKDSVLTKMWTAVPRKYDGTLYVEVHIKKLLKIFMFEFDFLLFYICMLLLINIFKSKRLRYSAKLL